MTIKYNTHLEIVYTNNAEYRECIRKLFHMKYVWPSDDLPDDLEDETRDEMNYDETQMTKTLDQLFALTENHPLFQELYDLAAARMFSTDRPTGQAILLSYDFLWIFHKIMSGFLLSTHLAESNEHYLELKRLL